MWWVLHNLVMGWECTLRWTGELCMFLPLFFVKFVLIQKTFSGDAKTGVCYGETFNPVVPTLNSLTGTNFGDSSVAGLAYGPFYNIDNDYW
jgi:hypothetical protein